MIRRRDHGSRGGQGAAADHAAGSRLPAGDDWPAIDETHERGIAVRTEAIQALCLRETRTERCFFPQCDGCGFDRIVDREGAADRGRIATREFVPDVRQRVVVTAIHAAIGNVCETPEEAISLLTLALSDYVGKVCKPEFRTEAFLTVIHCLRINAGMDHESDVQR